MNKKYSIQKNVTAKSVDIKLMGQFEESDAAGYLGEFEAVLKTINPAEYALNFDATELKVSNQDVIGMLEKCFELYKSKNFNAINTKIGGNATLSLQVKRVARKVGLTNFNIVSA